MACAHFNKFLCFFFILKSVLMRYYYASFKTQVYAFLHRIDFCSDNDCRHVEFLLISNGHIILLLKLTQVFLYLILISLGVPFLTLVIHFEQDQHCSCHNEILLSRLLLFFLPLLTTFSPNLLVVITILNLIAPSLLYLDCHLYVMLTFLLI